MRSLVVYDSQFGNTKKVAEVIGSCLENAGRVLVIHARDVQAGDLSGINLLVVGSPTQGFTLTKPVRIWIRTIPSSGLAGVRAAAFDTRFTEEVISKNSFLNFLVGIFGYAAKPIADRLQAKGAEVVLPPEGFFVADTEGPLLEQELERAADWARKLII
jgi:flavodoxin